MHPIFAALRARVTGLDGGEPLPAPAPVKEAAPVAEDEIRVYDVISSWGGVSASAFVDALKATTSPTVRLRINSPGGDVFDARAMVTAVYDLRASGRRVVSYIDGVAASAASYLALAADEVVMSDGAFFMIHNSMAMSFGNADEHAATVKLLRKVDDSIVAAYVAKTGKKDEKIRAWMTDETWFTAAEAEKAGFVDRVTGDPANASASAAATEVLAFYRKTPAPLIAALAPPAVIVPPAPEPAPAPAPAPVVDEDASLFENTRRHAEALALVGNP